MDLCLRGIQTLKDIPDFDITNLENTADIIRRKASSIYREKDNSIDFESVPLSDWPEQGYARREIYPWNDHEPDRLSGASLEHLNAEMYKVAPKLEVRVTNLPAFIPGPSGSNQR